MQTGKMCEVIQAEGLKPVHLSRVDGEVLGLTAKGLVHLVEVSLDFSNSRSRL